VKWANFAVKTSKLDSGQTEQVQTYYILAIKAFWENELKVKIALEQKFVVLYTLS